MRTAGVAGIAVDAVAVVGPGVVGSMDGAEGEGVGTGSACGGTGGEVLWVAALLIRLAGTWGEVSRGEVTFWLALGVTGSVVLPGARAGPCSTA